jgi:hypothetical protein
MTRYPNRQMHSFYLDPELSAGLKAIKERDGISESEQVRRAVRLWLESKGLRLKAVARKGGTRTR